MNDLGVFGGMVADEIDGYDDRKSPAGGSGVTGGGRGSRRSLSFSGRAKIAESAPMTSKSIAMDSS